MFDDKFVDTFAAALWPAIERELEKRLPDLAGTRLVVTQRLFSVREAAAYLGRSPKAVEIMIERKALPVTRIDGRRVQIDRYEMDRIIGESTH